MITLPAVLFGSVIALLTGALFHAVRGGNGWRFLLYMGLSALGFFAGQFFVFLTGWILFKFGVLDLGSGVAGSLIVLVLGDWLSRIKPNPKSGV